MNKMLRFSLCFLLVLISALLINAASYKFPVNSKQGLIPSVGDMDYDSISEFALISDEGELIVLNAETMKSFYAALSSNWASNGEVYINEKNDIFYAVKIPFNEKTHIPPFIFDVNKDGTEDIILAFSQSGKLVVFDYSKLNKDVIEKKEDIKVNDYIIWTNTLSDDEITGPMSLFQKRNKYYIAFGTRNENLVLVDLHTGNFEKKIDLHEYSMVADRRPVKDSPLVHDINRDYVKDIIIGTDSGSVTALNGANFKHLWTYSKKNSPILFSPTVLRSSSKTILIIPFKEYRVVGVDASNGKELWYFNTEDPILGAVSVDDINKDGIEEVIFATHKGVVTCLNGETGKKLWSLTTSKVSSTPTIYDFNQDLYGDIVIANDNGIIEVYNSKTKALLQGYKFITKGTQQIKAQPFVGDFDADGIVDIAVNSTDGNFYMFTDPNKIESKIGELFCFNEKGDPFRTGSVVENNKNNAKIMYSLNETRKTNFYKIATAFLQQNNINLAAVYFKKVLNIDPDYKDSAEQFSKIVDNFLSISYDSFQKALENDEVKEAKKILLEIESTSSEYEKLSEMRSYLKKKIADYKESKALFEEGERDFAGGRIVVGYEKLEKAFELNSTNKAIETAMKNYSYSMDLYREMDDAVKAKKWGVAKEAWNKLHAKTPNFPGLTGMKSNIFINANMYLIIAAAGGLVGVIVFLVFFFKRQKKKKEELMKQQIIEDKDEFSSENIHFQEDVDDEFAESDTALSVDQMQDSGIGLDMGTPSPEAPAAEYEDAALAESEEGSIELGGIDLGVEPSSETEVPVSPENENAGLDLPEDTDYSEQLRSEDTEDEYDAGYHEPADGAWGIDSSVSDTDDEPDMAGENREVRMTMAVQFYEEERYDEALEEFSHILSAESPFRYKAMAYAGFCHYSLGNTDESMKVIKGIPYQSEEIPVDERSEILQILGEGFVKIGLMKPALQSYKKLIDLTDGLEKKIILYKLGDLELEVGNKDQAIKHFKELFLMDPNYKDVGDKLDELGFS
ncbi:PQQ-binding-like beta-propeller repeat protein [bacterium]|nr:PQQ-binding-like beta-propeller repeat protein [bacterium]